MEDLAIRRAGPADGQELGAMRHALWPDATAAEHAAELMGMLAGKPPGTLPAVIFVAQEPAGGLVGFIEVSLRSHADGCDIAQPVGFVEGWYVVPAFRRKNVGARLLGQAEQWAREQGCREMASDTWIDNIESQQVHERLGFEVVDRCVNFRKLL